ncbi:hypothetical protein P7K49_021907, partial [Saguinus oedipus]
RRPHPGALRAGAVCSGARSAPPGGAARGGSGRGGAALLRHSRERGSWAQAPPPHVPRAQGR